MASEGASTERRHIPLFLPFILGMNSFNSIGEIESPPDRIILVNPITQGMVVIERSDHSSSTVFESLLNDILSEKRGRPPASTASIDAMGTVEITGDEKRDDDNQCAICLEEWAAGDKAKEMSCRHRFHGECIDKWLGVHGTCPVCRFEMPVDEDGDGEKRRNGERRRRREIWMSFVVGRDSENGESNESSSSSHQEGMEV